MIPKEVHHGALAERLIRQSGYSITRMAQELGIGRNTLYRKFEDAVWSEELRLRLSACFGAPFDLSLQSVAVPRVKSQALGHSYRVFVTLLAKETNLQVLEAFQKAFATFSQDRQAALAKHYVA